MSGTERTVLGDKASNSIASCCQGFQEVTKADLCRVKKYDRILTCGNRKPALLFHTGNSKFCVDPSKAAVQKIRTFIDSKRKCKKKTKMPSGQARVGSPPVGGSISTERNHVTKETATMIAHSIDPSTTDLPNMAIHSIDLTTDLPNMAVNSIDLTTDLPNMAVHSIGPSTTDLSNMALHSIAPPTTVLPNMAVHSIDLTTDLPNMAVNSIDLTTDLPNMAVHSIGPSTTDLPNMTGHSIDLSTDLPNMAGHSIAPPTTDLPNMAGHSIAPPTTDLPNMAVHSNAPSTTDLPNMAVHSIDLTNDLPNMAGHSTQDPRATVLPSMAGHSTTALPKMAAHSTDVPSSVDQKKESPGLAPKTGGGGEGRLVVGPTGSPAPQRRQDPRVDGARVSGSALGNAMAAMAAVTVGAIVAALAYAKLRRKGYREEVNGDENENAALSFPLV
ncbi:uncharacterized protein LOC144609285 [Rhinoraja longicauda]